MAGMCGIYIALAMIFASIYYLNLQRDPAYLIRNDTVFLAIIILACSPFVVPIALMLYLVWRFHDKE